MNKAELAAELGKQGIEFPRDATVADLRALFAKTIGKPTTTSNESDNLKENHDGVTNQNSGEKTANSDTVTPNSDGNNASVPKSDANDSDKSANSAGDSNKNDSDKNENSAKKTNSDENDDEEKEQRELDELLLRVPSTPSAKKWHEMQMEEELLDAKLRIMEKKKRLAELEAGLASNTLTPIAQHFLKPSYKDVKHLVPLFSNAEDYDARKWIADFERACDTVNADNMCRLKFFRQSMKTDSEGELFLRTDTSANYSEIRAIFLVNFGHMYSVSEVIDKLRKTTLSSVKTSVMGYILKMQEIASRAAINELQVVQFIIQGLQDTSANIAVLYSAQTIAQL